ncbi:helicase SNF2 [Rhodocytophaga rosea]|uniref:Helicase SNF2 n=1 Tax=Rhodocytophaga rosea TaxID=2704465 RepID=A0A6C0GDT7_9BACT|nr:SNF2-related protein [Rhodocytophaga rosea]QHT66126.1 helicase SNF2 [Rhodocytophaga rosea]
MAVQFGNTWWGKQWLNAFSNIDFSNRLPRGRSYARNGSVKSMEIDKQIIAAKVQGSQRTPYKIKISVKQFSAADKKTILEAITRNPAFLAKLLSRELPNELKDELSRRHIDLFPRSWRDMDATCSCPDWAVPCKHIAAIIYLFANEIDKNPFVLFTLHGMNLLAEIETAGFKGAQKAVASVPSVSTLLETLQSEIPATIPDKSLLDKLDFSHIPDSRQELLSLLSPNPLFFNEGDFKKILDKKLKAIGQEAARALIHLETESDEKATPEIYPEAVTHIHIQLDDELRLPEIRLLTLQQSYIWKGRRENPVHKLAQWLQAIPLSQLYQCGIAVRSLAALQRFSLILLRQGAIIPHLLHIEKDSYLVHWQPAMLKEEVRNLADLLAQVVPPDVLTVQVPGKKEPLTPHYFSPQEQVMQLLSLFLTHFIQQYYISERGEHPLTNVFFKGETLDASGKDYSQAPQLIYLWLKRFYISRKEIVPLLQIKEGNTSDFIIELYITHSKQALQEPVPLQTFFSDTTYQDNRLDVLQDLSVLTEYFPRLNNLIASQGVQVLEVQGQEFVDIFVRILPMMRLLGIAVLLPKSLQKLIRPSLSLAIDASEKGVEKHFLSMDELLSYKWQVAIGNEQVSAEEFMKLVKGLSGIVKIRDQYVMVDPNEVRQLIDKLKNPPELKSQEVLQAALAEEYAGSKIRLSGKAQAVLKSLLEVKKVALPTGLQANLRPYQQRGFEWLYKNSSIGFGSIIADDMGLGKTLQVITTLLKFKEEGLLVKKKALVVVPTTLLTNWQKEVSRFAAGLTLHIYHGPNRKLPEPLPDVVLTTYGVIRSDGEKLSKLKWYTTVIDEAQNIKNPATAQTKAVKKLKSDVQIAMSGTPVENRMSEYWSIMDFTNKGYLGSLKFFQSTYAYPIEVEQDQQKLDLFRKAAAPFILRRLKSDRSIISDLPDKVEKDEFCTLTQEQAALYQNVVEDIMKQIEEKEGIERSGLVFKLIMALKQICNHPAQFLKREFAQPELSGKTSRLLDLLDEIYTAGEKVLIFTQFQQMGELLQKLIAHKYHTEVLFLHGGCSRKQRDTMVDQFQNETAVKTMILSLKAGGTGLNLTAASQVIHYDLWWNPAVEAQATDRAFRIGQKKNVLVHRLLTQATFEEKINNMLKEKRELANMAVAQGEQWVGELSNKDLRQVFRLEK